MLTITPLARAGIAVLPPDVVLIDGTVGDFALAGRDGLASGNAIATAVVLCLLTDARLPDDELRPEHAGDARGWAGDGYDIDASRGEAELGSRLWRYRRHELTDATARAVEDEARRALQPLMRQGVAARIDVRAEARKAEGCMALAVTVVGRDGRSIADVRFDPLWRMV